VTAREAALRALGEYRRTKTWPDNTLDKFTNNMPRREAALAKRLVGGVLQNMLLCDYYAAGFSSIGLKKLEPRVLDILRLSIYQIVFLTKIPHNASVSEGAELASKFANPRATGFVNAILRKMAEAEEKGKLPEPAGGALQKLSIKYSHPEWLVGEFCALLGERGAEELLKANNAADTPATAQVNTLSSNADKALAMLKADGVEVKKHEWLEDCLVLRGAGNIKKLRAFKDGCIYIQDPAARLAVMAAGPKPGDFVIDGCAAPGGKSFAAAIAMKNTGRIAAFDIHAARLSLIVEGALRMGIKIIDVFEKDAAAGQAPHNYADVVLADVPCSGFGVIRKKPEIRYKTEREVSGLPDIQQRILAGLSAYVRPGGTLLYSTCSVLERENEAVVGAFLDGHKEFRTDGFSLPGVGNSSSGLLTLWPHIHGTDGFFICKMIREL